MSVEDEQGDVDGVFVWSHCHWSQWQYESCLFRENLPSREVGNGYLTMPTGAYSLAAARGVWAICSKAGRFHTEPVFRPG